MKTKKEILDKIAEVKAALVNTERSRAVEELSNLRGALAVLKWVLE